MSDLIINGKDALQEWGIRMGDNFVSNLLAPAGLKELIENESGLEDGKRVLYTNPRLADREVSLIFTIEGVSKSDFLNKYKSFMTELQKGQVKINVPFLGSDVYKLTYLKSSGFAMNTSMTFSKLTVKFNEPNPSQEGRGEIAS